MFGPDQIGIYFHWPFCKAKCPYCDFNVHIRESIDQSVWCDAYLKALEYYANILPDKQVVSVFFGGGTPSLMDASTIEAILNHIQKLWRISNYFEVTLEANPTSVELEKFKDFRLAGVNRVSLGVQSLKDSDLAFLGRKHTVQEARKAIAIAGEVFDRYSFDLIYARPDQSLKAWEDELLEAIKLAHGHLSLYQLTIERNTPFYMQYNRGVFSMPDDGVAADFYTMTQEVLSEHGLPAYEVSNHAAAGHECKHNLLYWHYGDYIGIGPGAHGRFTVSGIKQAVRDHSAPEIWLERVRAHGHGGHSPEFVEGHDRFAEILMMGLRLSEGLQLSRIKKLSGIEFMDGIHKANLEKVMKEGWIKLDPEAGVVSLTQEGMLRFNSILPYILS